MLAGFDELSVLNGVSRLYKTLDGDNRKAYKKLFMDRYLEMTVYLGEPRTGEDTLEEMAELYLSGLLSEPDPITLYSYDAEAARKRERVVESVTAIAGKVMKQVQMDKGIRFWNQMSAQYADEVSDGASVMAMEDAGIERVVWNTAEDDVVCRECKKRDGRTYSIRHIPAKPHWRCRCWVSPAPKKTI